MIEKHGEVTDDTPLEADKKCCGGKCKTEERVEHTTKRASDAAAEEIRRKHCGE